MNEKEGEYEWRYEWEHSARLGGYRYLRKRYIPTVEGLPSMLTGTFATGWEVVPLCCGDWEVFYQLRRLTTVSHGDEAREFVELTVSLGFDPATLGN